MGSVDKKNVVPNSLGIPSWASFVIKVKSKAEIQEAIELAKRERLPLIPLGDGTNTLPRSQIKAVVMILELKGIIIETEKLAIQAGENWDEVVKFAVAHELSGIEALSGIPGLAGATPIQNIGAYGSEIADTIESVEVYDKEKEKFLILKKSECDFSYRNSIFKKNPERFIVTSMTLGLSKEKPKTPDYKDVKKYFAEKNNNNPSLLEIREAIINIRKNKLPDPSVIPNAGSYFTNPILEEKVALQIKSQFPEVPLFPFQNQFKISAGWLIEQVGLKGEMVGKIKIYDKNALVLTNPEHATFEEIREAEETIHQKVFQKFNITLDREPRII